MASRSEPDKVQAALGSHGGPPAAAPKGTSLETWNGQEPAAAPAWAPAAPRAGDQGPGRILELTRPHQDVQDSQPQGTQLSRSGPDATHTAPPPAAWSAPALNGHEGAQAPRRSSGVSSQGRERAESPMMAPAGPAPSTRRHTARPRQAALALCLPGQTTALLGEKYPQLPQVFKYFQQLYKNLFPW